MDIYSDTPKCFSATIHSVLHVITPKEAWTINEAHERIPIDRGIVYELLADITNALGKEPMVSESW